MHARAIEGVSITSDKARTSAIVPILVDGEYVGAIGFDDWQRVREFDSSIVSALEIAAGLVGAALHRERLVETMRASASSPPKSGCRQRRAPTRCCATNLTKLARDADPQDFVSNILHRRHRARSMPPRRSPSASTRPPITGTRFIHVEDGKAGSAALPGHGHAGRNPPREVLTEFKEPVVLPGAAARPHASGPAPPPGMRAKATRASIYCRGGRRADRRAASAWCSGRTKR